LYPSIQVGPLLLPTAGILLWAGLLALVATAAARARHNGLERGVVVGAVLAGIAAFAGCGWLFHDSLQWQANGGGTTGDALAAVAVAVVWAALRRVKLLQLADCVAPALALFLFIARVGCFMAGCGYGRPTGHAWGVKYTNGLALAWYGTPLGIPLHPTQLYECALAAVIFVFLVLLRNKPWHEGAQFSASAAVYSVGRFLIEFLRGDAERGFLGPLSDPQWLCVLVFAAVVLSRIHGGNPSGGVVTPVEVSSHR
jgi:phosphatidylglycerol:prolipoprotein diacylglycerol transferase